VHAVIVSEARPLGRARPDVLIMTEWCRDLVCDRHGRPTPQVPVLTRGLLTRYGSPQHSDSTWRICPQRLSSVSRRCL